MVTNMSKAKIYILLLALGLIVSACGGGSSSNNTLTNQTLQLTDEQKTLLGDLEKVLNSREQTDNGNQQAPSPIIARNESGLTIRTIDNTEGSPLEGTYYAVFSEETYTMTGNRNAFQNPVLEREPGQTKLGKVGLTFGTRENGNINIVMLFNNDGNAVIALSSFDDFVAGGLPFAFQDLPTGDLTYSGRNYYKIDSNEIQFGDFELSVDFSNGSGEFTSGLDGNITLDPTNGTYTGTEVSMEVGGVTYSLNEMRGQFHGTSEDSSVTGLYLGSSPSASDIKGVIIGTDTSN